MTDTMKDIFEQGVLKLLEDIRRELERIRRAVEHIDKEGVTFQ